MQSHRGLFASLTHIARLGEGERQDMNKLDINVNIAFVKCLQTPLTELG